MIDKKVVQDIKSSKTKWGELYPVLEAADGEILDGVHRTEVGWTKRERLEKVETTLDKLAVRFIANFDRRTMSVSEKKELINRIAVELINDGIAKPDQNSRIPIHLRDRPAVVPLLVELLGVSEQTVNKYLSDIFKRSGETMRGKSVGLQTASPEQNSESIPLPLNSVRKRAAMELRAEILKDLSVGSLKATNLMYKANLSWKPLQLHLKFLSEKGLIDFSSDSQSYFLTVKGRKVLTHFFYVEHQLLVPEVEPTVMLEVVENSLRSMYRQN